MRIQRGCAAAWDCKAKLRSSPTRSGSRECPRRRPTRTCDDITVEGQQPSGARQPTRERQPQPHRRVSRHAARVAHHECGCYLWGGEEHQEPKGEGGKADCQAAQADCCHLLRAQVADHRCVGGWLCCAGGGRAWGLSVHGKLPPSTCKQPSLHAAPACCTCMLHCAAHHSTPCTPPQRAAQRKRTCGYHVHDGIQQHRRQRGQRQREELGVVFGRKRRLCLVHPRPQLRPPVVEDGDGAAAAVGQHVGTGGQLQRRRGVMRAGHVA